MPVIVDHEGADGEQVSVFESGAILMYLGEKAGKFFPQTPKEKFRVLSGCFGRSVVLARWLVNSVILSNYAPNFPGDHSYSTERYKNEYDRLLGVMDTVLKNREYLAGDYSIADMASFPWVLMYKRFDVNLDAFDNLRRWFDAIKNRPAVRKGIDLGKELRNPNANQSKRKSKNDVWANCRLH